MIPGEIRWVNLPNVPGHEQTGRRPAIIMQDDTIAAASPLVFVVPLTTQLSTRRFPGTVFVPPSELNGLTAASIALVFQFRALDRQRIEQVIGRIDPGTCEQVYKTLELLIGRATITKAP